MAIDPPIVQAFLKRFLVKQEPLPKLKPKS